MVDKLHVFSRQGVWNFVGNRDLTWFLLNFIIRLEVVSSPRVKSLQLSARKIHFIYDTVVSKLFWIASAFF